MNMRSLVRTAGTVTLLYLSVSLVPALARTTSPFQPPDEKLGVYVVNSGPGLDTGCTFRSGGPLLINIDIPIVVSDTQVNANGKLINADALVSRGIIGRTAQIDFPVWDVDSDAIVSPPWRPEINVVSFNGVRKGTLEGSNNIWTNAAIQVDISELKFGMPNELRIDIDTENTAELWCTAVDWVSVEFDVALPYVLAHGINTTGPDTWEPEITGRLNEFGVRYTFFTVGRNGSVTDNARQLETNIKKFLDPIKADKVHIIAHSKGGLDSQALQAIGPDFNIRSLSTLSTPHLGSVVADINIIQLMNADRLENVGEDPNGYIASLLRVNPWAGTFANVPERPGLDDLTTQAAAAALNRRQRGNISPTFAYGGDADINQDGTLQSGERPFFGADIPWNVMRNFSRARVVRTYTEPGFLGFGTRTVIEFEATPAGAPLRNDVVVTVNSARPSYVTDLGVVLENHSSIVDFRYVEQFLNRTLPLR